MKTMALTGILAAAAVARAAVPIMPPDMIDAAMAKGLLSYKATNPGCDKPFAGPFPVVVALSSFAGNTKTDARVVQQVRHCLKGNKCPGCSGAFSTRASPGAGTHGTDARHQRQPVGAPRHMPPFWPGM